MFQLREDRRAPLESISNERLRRLLDYWRDKRAGRAMPTPAAVDPLDLREHLGRLHLLDVVERNLFRFRIYGSGVTNPDVRDMTGRTTREYVDTAFRDLVTRHYQECVEAKAPVYHVVSATLDEAPYQYSRLTLPLSEDGENVTRLLVSPHRVRISIGLPSRNLFEGS